MLAGIPKAIWHVSAISLIYWICAGMRAAYRPFGFGELETHLPRVNAICGALCAAAVRHMAPHWNETRHGSAILMLKVNSVPVCYFPRHMAGGASFNQV